MYFWLTEKFIFVTGTGFNMNKKNNKNVVLLTAIEYACDALIACRKQINNLDHGTVADEEKCGSKLTLLAEVIKTNITKNIDVNSLQTSEIIIRISETIKEKSKDLQAQVYSKLFFALGKVSVQFLLFSGLE